MNKTIITLSGVFGGVIYYVLGEIGLFFSTSIRPPEWLHEKMEPFSWAVNIWRIVEWGPLLVIALIVGWGLIRVAKEGAIWAALISAILVSLVLVNRLGSAATLLNPFAMFMICLLPVVVFLMKAYNKSLNTDASDAGAG